MPKTTVNPYAGRAHEKPGSHTSPESRARCVPRDNGLTIAQLLMFSFAIGAMALTGWRAHNTFLAEQGSAPFGLARYPGSGNAETGR